MAFPVVQNTQTNFATASSSVVVTKPTGLSVGDLLVAEIGFYQSGGSRTITTPTGFTERTKSDGASTGVGIYTKVADSGDVAASNFTFQVSSAADCLGASLSRIDNYSSVGSSESDSDTGGGTSASYTTAITPTVSDNLILMAFVGSDGTYTGTPTVSGYATTPSETFTEIADVGVKNGANIGLAFGVATANNTGLDQITNRSVNFNDTVADRKASSIIIIEGIINGAGTAGLLVADADFFAPTASSGTSGTAALHSADADFFSQSVDVTNPTVWTPITKT